MRVLSGFMARVCTGFFGQGKQVKHCTVSSTLTAMGQMIALACNNNPTKINRSKKPLPRLQIMLDGYRKEDPPMIKKLPVQADVPNLLVSMAYNGSSKDKEKALADLAMIAFYYLLRVGEYTVKRTQNSTKQTVQFKYEDVTFFCKNNRGQLRCLPQNAPVDLISIVDGAMLKLDNQKNGWKGVCVYHKMNGNDQHCPVQALGCQYLHLWHHGATAKTFLLEYFTESKQRLDITNKDISVALKRAATVLDYPTAKGIPINQIDTHSLRSSRANALSLAGFLDTQIQKMGRWCGATFKECIQEELASFLEGMSRKMKQKFHFVNVAGNSFTDITDNLIHSKYGQCKSSISEHQGKNTSQLNDTDNNTLPTRWNIYQSTRKTNLGLSGAIT
jgi:hypothetical protein